MRGSGCSELVIRAGHLVFAVQLLLLTILRLLLLLVGLDDLFRRWYLLFDLMTGRSPRFPAWWMVDRLLLDVDPVQAAKRERERGKERKCRLEGKQPCGRLTVREWQACDEIWHFGCFFWKL